MRVLHSSLVRSRRPFRPVTDPIQFLLLGAMPQFYRDFSRNLPAPPQFCPSARNSWPKSPSALSREMACSESATAPEKGGGHLQSWCTPLPVGRTSRELHFPSQCAVARMTLGARPVRWQERFIVCRNYTEADSRPLMAGDELAAADHVGLLGYRVSSQISIFSAISIASSTSIPR